ncbi:MAG: phosphoribosylaminoimidazolesuccinocarboxamide synthase [Actinobacteria bacterium]|nr:phosphoribosylaminoimidazolesuccinocarboxamide synthase [Actinomycetota bacterium]NBY15742.1 phosphoribosylaminoimidazolesuccinocarboxamide synthase [Actinomycetota bacterium]
MTNIAQDYELPAEYQHIYSGKVRDLYETPDGKLLFVASDRISAFDYVLPTTIPDKGRILTAMSLWWFDRLEDIVPNHIISTNVPFSVNGRATICEPLEMFPIECVARGYLTGSGLLDYKNSGSICGVGLPPGLVDGSRLPKPIFTPATKAAVGDHDENVTFDEVMTAIGQEEAQQLRRITMNVYQSASEIAVKRGIILADTKFEFGLGMKGSNKNRIVLADEVLTPDSSRFWPADQWAPGNSQPSYDKQFVRDWLLSADSGWDKNSGEVPPALPADVVEKTRNRYVQAYETLTGKRFQ